MQWPVFLILQLGQILVGLRRSASLADYIFFFIAFFLPLIFFFLFQASSGRTVQVPDLIQGFTWQIVRPPDKINVQAKP